MKMTIPNYRPRFSREQKKSIALVSCATLGLWALIGTFEMGNPRGDQITACNGNESEMAVDELPLETELATEQTQLFIRLVRSSVAGALVNDYHTRLIVLPHFKDGDFNPNSLEVVKNFVNPDYFETQEIQAGEVFCRPDGNPRNLNFTGHGSTLMAQLGVYRPDLENVRI